MDESFNAIYTSDLYNLYNIAHILNETCKMDKPFDKET